MPMNNFHNAFIVAKSVRFREKQGNLTNIE